MKQIPDIKNCPGTLAAGYATYNPTALRRVFDNKKVSHLLDFSNDEKSRVLIDDNIGRISISGVQEKLSAIIEKGKVILTPEGIQGRYIIKPIPDDKRLKFRNFMPANEHLTMQIARQVYGIATAENALLFFQDGEPAYITKRFDINTDGLKVKQEDFASLSQKTSETHGKHFKYTGNYTDMGLLFPKYVAAWQIEVGKFFRLVLFNYLFGNGDAHLKNFSLQQSENGDYMLSPAYDLLNSSLHIQDENFALEGGLSGKEYYSEIYLQKGHPCQGDFITFGKMIAVPDIQIQKIMKNFLASQPLVYELTERSFLDDRLKRMYIRSYEERMDRLKRTVND
ncbi:MAG: HipA domain-containing protein [Culturomica sp.]|jgi:serine/threonine-protein kinase HipA|nr:HipA domain-containing protein [Culturomica sp.]